MQCPATPEFASWVQAMESNDDEKARSAIAQLEKSERDGNLQTFDYFRGAIDCTVSCLACSAVVSISTSVETEDPVTTIIAGKCHIANTPGQQG